MMMMYLTQQSTRRRSTTSEPAIEGPTQQLITLTFIHLNIYYYWEW